MKILWGIGSLVAVGWGISWAATEDSWWRLLVVLAASLASLKALHGEWYAAGVSLLVAAGVVFKVLLVGADQRAGIADLASSSRWELWMMATWLGVALLSLRYSLEATAAFALVGLAFAFVWWHEAIFLHVIAEIGVVFGLAAIWRRWDGQLIGVAENTWRNRNLGRSLGWFCRGVGPSHNAKVSEEKD